MLHHSNDWFRRAWVAAAWATSSLLGVGGMAALAGLWWLQCHTITIEVTDPIGHPVSNAAVARAAEEQAVT